MEKLLKQSYEQVCRERINKAKRMFPAGPNAQNWVINPSDDSHDPSMGTLNQCLEWAEVAPKSFKHWRTKALRDGYIEAGAFGAGSLFQQFYTIEWNPEWAARLKPQRG